MIFDLVHARYVLIHIPDSSSVNQNVKVTQTGWIVLEEPDFSARAIIEIRQLVSRWSESINLFCKCLKTEVDYALGVKLLPNLQQHL